MIVRKHSDKRHARRLAQTGWRHKMHIRILITYDLRHKIRLCAKNDGKEKHVLQIGDDIRKKIDTLRSRRLEGDIRWPRRERNQSTDHPERVTVVEDKCKVDELAIDQAEVVRRGM